MRRLELILRTPPLIITALSTLAAFEPVFSRRIRAFDGDYWSLTVAPILSVSTIAFFAWLLWLFSLHEASFVRTPPNRRPDRWSLYLCTALSTVVLLLLASSLYDWPGDPPGFLLSLTGFALFVSVLGALASTWAASDSFRRFELSARAPEDPEPWNPLFPILFIFVGIWFIHRRIQNMLDHPLWMDQPA